MKERNLNGLYSYFVEKNRSGYSPQMELYRTLMRDSCYTAYSFEESDDIVDAFGRHKDNLGFDIDQLITVLRQETPQPKTDSNLVKKEITKFKL